MSVGTVGFPGEHHVHIHTQYPIASSPSDLDLSRADEIEIAISLAWISTDNPSAKSWMDFEGLGR